MTNHENRYHPESLVLYEEICVHSWSLEELATTDRLKVEGSVLNEVIIAVNILVWYSYMSLYKLGDLVVS